MARPPKPEGTALHATVGVSVTVRERQAWHEAAARRGLQLAELVRRAVREYLQKHPPGKDAR